MVTRAFSTEDGNLQSRSIITSGSRLSKDINLLFSKKSNGDVYKKEDAAAVKQAVRNLLLTNHHEKPFNQFFGANLRGLLFELADDFLEFEINEAIITAVTNYEPRANILGVQTSVTGDKNSIACRIEFQIISTGVIEVIETSIARLR
jgi:phage baseplate assembly protein W|tara:strand:- start:217 stop:660 length:444 start_codon:yes stop_codon:yes gene_type:complete